MKCKCQKCGGSVVIEYIGEYGTIYAVRADGKIGRRLRSIKYEESIGDYMIYCPSCGEGFDGILKNDRLVPYMESEP